MAEVYKTFAEPWHHTHDFSDKALIDLYNSESYGTPFNEGTNGYSLGKKWLNVTVKMWLEDIELGTLYKFELYEDPRFPSWFLDGVLKGVQQKTILRM